MKRFTFFISLFIILGISYTGYSQSMSYEDIKPSVSTAESHVLIYPNPVTNNIFFVKSEKLIKKVELMNVLGQTIKTVRNETRVPYNILVEIGDIKKGMYMVQATLDSGEKVINKIIIK